MEVGDRDENSRQPTLHHSTLLADAARRIEMLASEIIGKANAQAVDDEVPANSLSKAIRIYKARRKTDEAAQLDGLSASPALDCLLDIYINTESGRMVPITSACIGAACAPTTALRWMHYLQACGLIERSPDPHDRRRTFVALTEKGRSVVEDAIRLY